MSFATWLISNIRSLVKAEEESKIKSQNALQEREEYFNRIISDLRSDLETVKQEVKKIPLFTAKEYFSARTKY